MPVRAIYMYRAQAKTNCSIVRDKTDLTLYQSFEHIRADTVGCDEQTGDAML